MGSDPRACGDSEPILSNLIRRGATIRMNDGKLLAEAKPAWRTASIGPGGPVPTAMLLATDRERLCLGRWAKAEATDGSAVTFAVCPKARSRAPRAKAKAAKAAKAGAAAAAVAEKQALERGEGAEAGKAAARAVIDRVARALDLVRVDASPHAQKWRASDASSWSVIEEAGGGVRIVPRQAPHLCLAVPRLHVWQGVRA